MPFLLTALEARVLGCLLEKERLTPENYPLSLNALTNACNQSTNREPVTGYDEKTVEEGVNSLREKKLASVVFGAGSRVQKYRHLLYNHFNLEPHETALLCILLLRGPQTPGELRTRTERMHSFAGLESVQSCLDTLARDHTPLVRQLEARPGQKERRYVQLLSAEGEEESVASGEAPTFSASPSLPSVTVPEKPTPGLAEEVSKLREELAQLREEFAAFRKQFE